MTDLLEQAIERIRALPADMQDQLARVLLALTEDQDTVYRLTEEEEADLADAEAEAARGELATEEQITSTWSKHAL